MYQDFNESCEMEIVREIEILELCVLNWGLGLINFKLSKIYRKVEVYKRLIMMIKTC